MAIGTPLGEGPSLEIGDKEGVPDKIRGHPKIGRQTKPERRLSDTAGTVGREEIWFRGRHGS